MLTAMVQQMLDTCISDNARLGIMPNLLVKGSMMADGAATPYDAGSPMQDGGYMRSPDYSSGFSPIAQSGGATPGGGFTEYQPQGFGGGLSPYSGSRSPGGYSVRKKDEPVRFIANITPQSRVLHLIHLQVVLLIRLQRFVLNPDLFRL